MVTKEEEWEGINWEFGINIYTLLYITFPLEEEMATHSSILAWEIQRTEESGRLQSMESQRVGHDWVTEQAGI